MSEILRILGHQPLSLDNEVMAVRFKDRQKCDTVLFNELLNLINSGQKAILIFDDQEEIQNINYLFSKHGLAHKNLILLQNSLEDHPGNVLFQPSKNRDVWEARSTQRVAKEIQDDINNINGIINRLWKEKFGTKTLVEIIDLATKSKFHDFETPATILSPPYDYDKYLLKKNLYDKAESLYDVSFINLDKINPFSDSFIKEHEVSACLSILKDDLQDVEELLTKFEHAELQLRKQMSAEDKATESELNGKVEQLRDMLKELPWSDTDVEKMIFHQSELLRLFNVNREPPSRKEEIHHCQDHIEKLISDRRSHLFRINEKKLYDHLKSLTFFNADSKEVSALIKKSQELICRINSQEIYRHQVCGVSVAFFYQNKNLLEIKNSIVSSIDFIESNTDYLLWKQFETQLDSGDVKMVSHLSQSGAFWAQTYEEIFLSYFLSNQRTAIRSLNQYTDKLMFNVQELDDENLGFLVDNSNNSGIANEILKYESWSTLLGEASASLTTAFPVIMIEQQVFRTHGSALMANIDKVFHLNYIPTRPGSEDWIRNLSIGYTSDYIHQCDQYPVSNVADVHDIDATIDRKLSMMNSTDLRAASKYLSQEICRFNNDYRIYQTKACSIVTFLSDTKNSSILMPMLDKGIKEIISNKTGVDLLAGLISDTDKHTLILLEDGLFSCDTPIVPQLKLRSELNDAGVQVISVDNVDMITDREEIMNRTIDKILKLDMGEMVHAN